MNNTPDYIRSSASSRSAALLVALLAATLLVLPAAAHNPTAIGISYDPGAEKLWVTITHPVDDPASHYVNKVRVQQNGRTISDPDYKSQPDKNTFTYSYDVRALPGDTFWVMTTCSRGGTLEKKFDVIAPATATTIPAAVQSQAPVAPVAPVATTQKSPAGLLPLIGAAAAVWLVKKE